MEENLSSRWKAYESNWKIYSDSQRISSEKIIRIKTSISFHSNHHFTLFLCTTNNKQNDWQTNALLIESASWQQTSITRLISSWGLHFYLCLLSFISNGFYTVRHVCLHKQCIELENVLCVPHTKLHTPFKIHLLNRKPNM